MSDVDDLRYEVVFSAGEAATGVHEVLWAANTWWPDKPASERLRLAEDAVRWALDRELVALHYDDTEAARPLAAHECNELLREWRTWAVPDGPRLYLSRTAAGDSWLEQDPRR